MWGEKSSESRSKQCGRFDRIEKKERKSAQSHVFVAAIDQYSLPSSCGAGGGAAGDPITSPVFPVYTPKNGKIRKEHPGVLFLIPVLGKR